MSDNSLKHIVDVAAGRRPADLVLKNGKIVNVLSHEIHDGDVAIAGERIVGIGQYESRHAIDLKGRYVCPGFFDAHVHIESSLLSVPEFARVVICRGTTAVAADPHEFANVMGVEGISFVARTAKYAPIDVFLTLSSCVPASPFEAAGGELNAEDLKPFITNKWVLGLAEMMNYPGVIAANEEVLAKIEIAKGRAIDGHCPSVHGRDLNAYVAAGIMSDHECVTAAEAAEKLQRGLSIMIREGSQTRNLKALLPLVKPANAHRFMFCTDDKDVSDLLAEGHIDYMIRTAIGMGLDPILAVRLASFNAANYFGVRYTGAIAPGYKADIAILEDLKGCRVTQVIRRGALIAENGRCLVTNSPAETQTMMRSSMNTHWMEPADFEIPAEEGFESPKVGESKGPTPPTLRPSDPPTPPRIHVIHVMENRIDTERSIQTATVRDGQLVADPSRDLAKLVAIERHHGLREIGHAFVTGFGLKAGAIASSVAHDAHNIIVVGMSDADMMTASVRLIKLHGGVVVVKDGEVLAEMPLPIAGLVSDAPAEIVAEQLRGLAAAGKSLNCPLAQPFMALAFLSLSVIGKLKLTTRGLIDVERFEVIPLVAT